jgi:hypothetical protein
MTAADREQIDSLGGVLSYQDVLPLRWSRRDPRRAPDDAFAASRNAELLQYSAIMDDRTAQRPADEADEHTCEFQVLEAKLNLLLGLVTQLLSHHVELPEKRPVRLSSRWLEWAEEPGSEWPLDARLPAVGEHLTIELFVRPELPYPLVLDAEVQHLQEHEHGTLVRTLLTIGTQELQDFLDRLIFQHHRKSVAARRGGFSEG